MGVDYVVGYECEPKKEVGTERLIDLCKRKAQAETVLQMTRNGGDNRPPSEITFTRFVETPGGRVEENVNLQKMFDEVKELDRFAGKCSDCPANTEGRAVGCYGYVAYPITDEQESWIMSRLPGDLDSLRGKFLCKAIGDFGYDGGEIPRLRRQGEVFLQRNRPIKRRWGGFLSGRKITSDQILQMMFGLGDLDPGHCMVLCLALGMVKDDATPDDVMAAGRDASKRREMLQPLEGETRASAPVDQIRGFLNAARQASIMEVPLMVRA